MTFQEFKKIPAGEVFRVVTTQYHTIHSYVGGAWPELTFVCKKGLVYDDWVIYCHLSNRSVEWIWQHGDKVSTDVNILSIFPCDEETLKHYRY